MKDIQTKYEDTYGKYVFDEDEKKEMAEQMARAFSEKTDLELKISTLSRDYNQGHKFMNIPCRVEYDFRKKEVRAYRKDSMEIFSTRIMTQNEFQQEIFDKDGHSITAPEDDTDDRALMKDENLETANA